MPSTIKPRIHWLKHGMFLVKLERAGVKLTGDENEVLARYKKWLMI